MTEEGRKVLEKEGVEKMGRVEKMGGEGVEKMGREGERER